MGLHIQYCMCQNIKDKNYVRVSAYHLLRQLLQLAKHSTLLKIFFDFLLNHLVNIGGAVANFQIQRLLILCVINDF